MPAVHELLHQKSLLHPSDRSSPSRFDHHPASSPNDQHVLTLDRQSSSSRLSQPSKLSDENLQRQLTGVKERVKKSIKMRETERWARETASSSLQNSPNHPSQSSSPMIKSAPVLPHHPLDSEDLNLSHGVNLPSSIQPATITNTLSSPSPETLPRPRISVQPVPSFRAIPTNDSGVDSMIVSEHASVNDWHSENTNNTHLAGSSHHPSRTFFPLSPVDVQIVGQTPTSVEFQSLNNFLSPTVLAGTVIGPIDGNTTLSTSKIITLPLSPFLPPSVRPPSPPSPRIREISLTPPSREPPPEVSDPLLKARITLEEALSTTPQARSCSNPSSSPSPSPVRHYHHPRLLKQVCHSDPPQNGSGNHEEEEEEEEEKEDEDEDEEEEEDDDDDESGLSPIKEDRTAELAAEHSWRIKHTLSPRSPARGTLNQRSHCLNLQSVASDGIDRTQPSCLPVTLPSEIDHPTVLTGSEHQAKTYTYDQITPTEQQVGKKIPVDLSNAQEPNNKLENLGRVEINQPMAPSLSNDDEPTSHNTLSSSALSSSDDSLQIPQPSSPAPPRANHSNSSLISTNHSPISASPRTDSLVPRASSESIASRRQLPSFSVRTGSLQKPNPPLSIPASARRPPPTDLLNRLEMEEWRVQTGVDDRYSLSLRPTSSSLTAGSLGMNCGLDIDRAGLVGLGGEERRGIKDRWGNSWGLESHVLSPLTEHTERSLTTVGSLLSLSTRKSSHSLRSLDSTSNSIAQRLEQADTNNVRMMKLTSPLVPSGVVRSTSTNVANSMSRSVSCPMNRIDSPTKLSTFKSESLKEPPHLLLEEKLKRKEERRLKREKREKRRAEEIKSSESLAQKQERRRQEKKKKEQFLEKKHQILLRLQEGGENPRLVRDLGILYMTSNVGVAGLKLAIRHLETSLQMDDTDALAWSCLGKAWAQLHGVPEAELAKLPDPQEANKAQQAHNATIGLRKAIINSRTPADAMKHKVEWARYLEKLGRWRDSLGVIGEVIKNEGKQQPRCWAALGFIGLRIVFGWSPLNNLEADDLEQGFIEGEDSKDIAHGTYVEGLSDSDRMKLLSQAHNAFERALILIDGHNPSTSQAKLNSKGKTVADGHGGPQVDQVDCCKLKAYRQHYEFQLKKVEMIEKDMEAQDSGITDELKLNDKYSRPSGGLDSIKLAEQVGGCASSSGIRDPENSTDVVNKGRSPLVQAKDEPELSRQQLDVKTTQNLPHDSTEIATQETPECQSSHSSLSRLTVPNYKDPDPTRYADMIGNNNEDLMVHPITTSAEQSQITRYTDADITCLVPVTPPKSQQTGTNREMTGADYLSMSTPTSQIDRTAPLPPEHYDMRTPVSQNDGTQKMVTGMHLSMLPHTLKLHPPIPPSCLSTRPVMFERDGSCDGPELIVQYDDVDTTNEYSDSKNSDPFRPSSSLGHNLGRHLVSAGLPQNLPPFSVAPLEHRITENVIRSEPPRSENVGQPLQSSSSPPYSTTSAKPLPGQINLATGRDERMPSEPAARIPGQSAVCKDYSTRSSPMEHVENCSDLPKTTSVLPVSIESMPAISSQVESDGSVRRPSHTSSDLKTSSISPIPGWHQAHHTLPLKQPASPPQQRHELGPGDKLGLLDSRKASDSFSSNYLNGEIPPDDNIRRMCLNGIIDCKLKELDKEKVIAFLELDSNYHSKVSKLRKKLIQVEEERENKRREMFELLGIKEVSDQGENDDRIESFTGREGGREGGTFEGDEYNEGSEGGESVKTEVGKERRGRDGQTKTEPNITSSSNRRRIPSSFCSVRSSSSLPIHHHHHHHHPRDHYVQLGRADCKESGSTYSPNPVRGSSPTRGRALSLGGVADYQVRKTGELSCTSTAVAGSSQLGSNLGDLNVVPSSNESGQANIALQGIAAILKLATSAQTS